MANTRRTKRQGNPELSDIGDSVPPQNNMPNRGLLDPNVVNPNAASQYPMLSAALAAHQNQYKASYKIPLARYNGLTSAYRFLEEFSEQLQGNNFPRSEWVRLLIPHLDGAAKRFYHDWIKKRNAQYEGRFVPPITWEEASMAIQSGFQSHHNLAVLEQKCRRRKQTAEEIPEVYVYDLVTLLDDFDPNMSEATKVNWLTKNARPSYISNLTLADPKTVSEFLQTLRQIHKGQILTSERTDVAALEQQISELTVAVSAIDDKVTSVAQSTNQSESRPYFDRNAPRNRSARSQSQGREFSNNVSFQAPRNNFSQNENFNGPLVQNQRQSRYGQFSQNPPATYKCFICGNPGHLAPACPYRPSLARGRPNLQGGRPFAGPNNRFNNGQFNSGSQRFCMFHQVNTHDTSECRVPQAKNLLGAGRRGPPVIPPLVQHL